MVSSHKSHSVGIISHRSECRSLSIPVSPMSLGSGHVLQKLRVKIKKGSHKDFNA